MAAFRFEALDPGGKTVTGLVDADNPKTARSQLRTQQLVPLKVELVMVTQEASGGSRKLFVGRAFNSTALAIWTRQLSGLVVAGLPLERALTAMADEAEDPRQRELVAHLRSEVNAGAPFAQALSGSPREFDEVYRGVVAAGAGSGSGPAERGSWQHVASKIAESFRTRPMTEMADEIGSGPTRLQLKAKSPRAWQEFMDHLREHSEIGMANTMARYQARRPSLYDFEDQFRALEAPVLLAVGDEDDPCLETNLMLKRAIPNAGLWVHPHTGHAINLEEPAAFNAMVNAFLADVERSPRHRALTSW